MNETNSTPTPDFLYRIKLTGHFSDNSTSSIGIECFPIETVHDNRIETSEFTISKKAINEVMLNEEEYFHKYVANYYTFNLHAIEEIITVIKTKAKEALSIA